MLKNIILVFCVCSLVFSCYKYNAPKKPKKLISEEKMALVLLDLRLIGAVTGKDKKVLDSANITPQSYIQEKYGIDSLQFEENNAYYSYYVDEYQEIFNKVKDSLSKLKEYYKVILDKEHLQEQKQDSLKKIEKNLEKIDLETDIETGLIVPVSDKD